MQPKPTFKLRDLQPALLTASKSDPLVVLHLSSQGKQIVEDAAKSTGLTVSQFVRKALLHEVIQVYNLTE